VEDGRRAARYLPPMRVLGLDEAGRGCVLGPLVVGGFLYEGDDQAVLRAAGADDSKAIRPARRRALIDVLAALGRAEVVEVSAVAIDQGNLNTLEEDAFLALIDAHEPDAVYLDAPVHPRGIPALQRRMQARLQRARPSLWVVEPKADSTWPVVGAASIFAKVRRDARLAEIDAAFGPVGSGYPSDPVTRAWLQGYLRRGEALPDCVRTRWGTLDVLRQGTLL
jgi:ribonuclease HII